MSECLFRDKFSVSPSDVILQMTPLTFDPFIIEMFVSLASGAVLLVVPDDLKLNQSALVDVIVKNKVTIAQVIASLC